MCNIYDRFCTLRIRNNYNLSMVKRITSWQKFKNYIRTFKVGEIITRQLLIQNTHIASIHTIDSFRRCLEKNNVIKKIEEFRGAYIICHELPKDITFNELMLRGYGRKPKIIGEDMSWGRPIYETIPGVKPDPLYETASRSIFDVL